eukprot:1406660-Amphidinium_carterae.1
MTPVEAVQGGFPFVVVSSVTSSGMSTSAVATVAEPPLKRARCSTILDQTDETEVKPLSIVDES